MGMIDQIAQASSREGWLADYLSQECIQLIP
jgi:hypothetical protein